MSVKTFATLTLGAMFSLVIASQIQNEYMVMFSFVLLLLPAVAVVAQSEVK